MSLKLKNDIEIGYFKYKSTVSSTADCIREYPITEDIIKLINDGLVSYEIETENGEPKLINGLGIIFV